MQWNKPSLLCSVFQITEREKEKKKTENYEKLPVLRNAYLLKMLQAGSCVTSVGVLKSIK